LEKTPRRAANDDEGVRSELLPAMLLPQASPPLAAAAALGDCVPRVERASTGRLRRNCCLSSTAEGDEEEEEDGEGSAGRGDVRAEDDDDDAAWIGAGAGVRHVGNCWWGSPAPLGGKADEECDKDDDDDDDDDVAGCPMIAVVVPRR
jgi:hypothetical protein